MATVNNNIVTVNVKQNTNGYNLDGLVHHTPAEVKEKIFAAQNALRDLLDLSNGEYNSLTSAIYDEISPVYFNFLSRFVCDMPHEERHFDSNGHLVINNVDLSDVPFIRMKDEEFSYQNYEVIIPEQKMEF